MPNDEIYVIEANPRASRTVPFVAKAIGVPLKSYASLVMSGKTLMSGNQLLIRDNWQSCFCQGKEAVLPFDKFAGSDKYPLGARNAVYWRGFFFLSFLFFSFLSLLFVFTISILQFSALTIFRALILDCIVWPLAFAYRRFHLHGVRIYVTDGSLDLSPMN